MVDKRWIKQYRLEYPRNLDRFIGLLNSTFRVHKPRVLEIGSGPISKLANGIEKFELYCLDPLAREYGRLHRMIGMKIDFKFIEGTCEELDAIFRGGTFHLVYASNSLDHTDSPAVCIRRMFDMLKPYGILFVESHEREGSHQDWYGLHQYDLIPEAPNLCLKTKDGKAQNITKDLPLKQIFLWRRPEERYFAAAWQKIPTRNVNETTTS
jgi:SAM-dependent methyltransferase